MKERRLHRWWKNYDKGWVGHAFVAFPGWENHEEGPDFLNALIEMDGRLVRGDVEIHCDAKDWHAHGHDRDPRYNHVILHVVADPHGLHEVTTRDGRTVPTVTFSHSRGGFPIVNRQSSLVNLQRGGAVTRPYCKVRWTLLQNGGWKRFEDKIARLRRWTGQVGLEGALYMGLLDAYGYSKFRRPFRKLAHLVPLSMIQYPEGLKKLLAVAGHLRWKGAFVRPANRPSFRLWELASVLAVHQGHLKMAIQKAMEEPKPRVALERVGAQTKGLGRRVAVNVILPWLVLASRWEGQPLWAALARKWYREWPALESNAVTRRVARQAFGCREDRLPFRLTALTQQGLHWIAKHPESLLPAMQGGGTPATRMPYFSIS